MVDRKDWKALQLPFDEIMAYSGGEKCYRLSDRAVAALLSQTPYIYWPTRWSHDTPLDQAQRDQIDALAAYIEHQLMTPGCEGDVMDVRQNEENPCLLEKTTDGVTWEVFADLSLCMPTLRRDPNTGRYMWTTDDVTFFHFPEGPWVDVLPEEVFYTPRPRPEATTADRLCNAAANASSIMAQLYEEVGTNLLASVAMTDLGRAGEIGAIFSWLEAVLAVTIPTDLIALPALLGIVAIGAGYNSNPLTTDEVERLRCILFDNAVDTDGSITFDFNGVYAAIDFDHPKEDYFRLLMTVTGADALNSAGAAQVIDDANCDDCGLGSCEYIENMNGGLLSTTRFVAVGDPASFKGGRNVPRGEFENASGHAGTGRIKTTLETTTPHVQGAAFYVDLGEDCTLTSVTLWARKAVGAGDFTIQAKYFRSDFNGNGTNTQNVTSDAWTQLTFTGYSNVNRYIVFIVERVTETDLCYVDDIRVNV